MRYFLLSLFILACLPAFAQLTVNVKWAQHSTTVSSDTIYYSRNKKLEWPNFKAMPIYSAEAVALTSSGFGYLADVQYQEGKTDIVIEVYCYFSKQNSWVVRGRESDYALNHEQHHFDVAYIAANLFVQKLKAAKFTEENYARLLEEIYKESRKEFATLQNDYDGQTKNGQLKNIQEQWDILIGLRLHSF